MSKTMNSLHFNGFPTLLSLHDLHGYLALLRLRSECFELAITSSMNRFDLKKVLGNADSLAKLMSSKELIGVSFERLIDGKLVKLKGDALELGLLYLPDIPIDSNPGDIYSKRDVLVTLCVCVAAGSSSLTISNIDVLPESKDVDKPSFTYTFTTKGDNPSDDRNDRVLVGLPYISTHDEPLYLDLSISIPLSWSGFIGRTIVFRVSQSVEISAVAVVTTEMLMGLRVTGCVLTSKMTKALSTDAKPFIPKYLLRYFDTPLHTTHLQACSLPSISPPVFKKISKLIPKIQLPYQLKKDYIEALNGNRLSGDIVDRYCLRLDEDTSRDIQQYLRVLSNTILYEEIHMSYDICHYDLHFATFTFKKAPDGYLIAKFKVKGSNENRPHISVGDFVYLRPSKIADMVHFVAVETPAPPDDPEIRNAFYSSHNAGNINDSCNLLNLQANPFFEFVGSIISYKLATEEVVAKFLLPNTMEMARSRFNEVKNPTNLTRNDRYTSNAIDILNATPFHCRFSFDVSGFYFIQMAIRDLISNDRRLHQLFPSPGYFDTIQRLYDDYFDDDDDGDRSLSCRFDQRTGLALNREQMKAVKDIMFLLRNRNNNSYGDNVNNREDRASNNLFELLNTTSTYFASKELPTYVIYGPPGTGKSSCVVQSVLDAVAANPHYRVLACAPSDAAADVICERLAHSLSAAQMLRLCYWKKRMNALPASLFKYVHLVDGMFELPTTDRLRQFNVIVTTCGTSGVLSHLKVEETDEQIFFDLVIIDEASQATEAESLVPIRCAKDDGVIVLCGDSKQLAAQTRSPVNDLCSKYSSLQERLLLHGAYRSLGYTSDSNTSDSNTDGTLSDSSGFNKSIMGTYLTKNYRSHQSIISISSRLFYGNRLEPFADKGTVDSLQEWQHFPRTKIGNFACLFIGVNGRHSHELDSPSFFNIYEIEAVMKTVNDLVHSTTVKVSTADIGIICAFRAQVLRMRIAMREAGFGQINIGSVEDFQGQECKIIIISTVLSQKVAAFVTHKGAHGISGDFRKFNVAVTRGMALTVVVGNPFFLVSDPHWKAYLNYCDSHGCYTGCPCPYLDSAKECDLDLNVIAEYAAVMDGDEQPDTNVAFFNSDYTWRLMI